MLYINNLTIMNDEIYNYVKVNDTIWCNIDI